MAHISPAVNLVWGLLSVMLGSFLIFHLWSFDRFKCLKWNQGPHSGTFKRVMTYSYLLSIPLLIVYSVGFSIIKYSYGFTYVPGYGIMPTPYELWSPLAQSAILPLYLSFSIAWGLEMVTHLEELCFWLFVVNSTSAHQDWFRSPYFKIWAIGSCIAVLAMPLITIFTRENALKCEAYTFLAGGLGSFSLTIWFIPVLWTFPSFLANLKQHSVETSTLVRLTKFHELNCIRVVFRLLFTVPFIILAVDGVRPHQHINDKMFPTDLLAIIAGIGVVVSSGITLVIFFPRSIEGEMTLKEQQRSRRAGRSQGSASQWSRPQSSDAQTFISITHSKADLDLDHLEAPPVGFGTRPNVVGSNPLLPPLGALPSYDVVVAPLREQREREHERMPSMKMALDDAGQLGGSISLQPNRLNQDGDVELGAVLTESEVELIRTRSKRGEFVSSLVHQWRSPIEIGRPTVARWQRHL